MVVDKSLLYGENDNCGRIIGGNCAGNCRKTETKNDDDCSRIIGGNCAGNCRRTNRSVE